MIDAPATQSRTTPLSPQPTLQDLPAVLPRVRAAGPTADLRTDGDLAPLSSGLRLAVYRIVQIVRETLTNTLKHAAADTTVFVNLHRDGEAVHVTVRDAGPPRAAGSERRGGQGLIGMRRRAALYRGHINGGPTTAGGRQVHTVLSTSSTLSTVVTEKHHI
ncbi:ATP-binding protein [Streptomyces sp. NPDC051662]|uniref:sensor histidine kinase n=1 Tax=Streptomyces sp. NPDC051662 TaxID=3154750 RepID=UPI0034186972